MAAENCANAQKMPSGPKWSHYLDLLYFPHEVRFSAGIGPAHFPAGGTAIDACAAAIFTSLFQCLLLSRFCLQLDRKARCKDREYIYLLQILGRKRGEIRVERI